MKTLHFSIIIILIVSVLIPLLTTQNGFGLLGPPSLRFDHLWSIPVLHPGQTITFSIDVHNPNNVSFYDVKPVINIQSPDSKPHLRIETDSLDVLKPSSIGTVHVKVVSDLNLPIKDVTIITSFIAKSGTDIIKVADYSDQSTIMVQSYNILPPLAQQRLDIPLLQIECKDGAYLMIIQRENIPQTACASPEKIPRLVHQGWQEIRTYLDHLSPIFPAVINSQTRLGTSFNQNGTFEGRYSQICNISKTSCPPQQLTVVAGSGVGSLAPTRTYDEMVRYAVKVEPFIEDYPLIIKVTDQYSLTSRTYVLPAENATNGIFYPNITVNSQAGEEVSHVNFIYNGQRAEVMILPFLPP